MLNGAGGDVAVTVSSAVVCALLPQAFTQFRAQNPDMSVTVRELSPPAALDALRNGATDFAVATGIADTQWPDFVERRKIMSMPLLDVARQGHPLAQVRSVSKLHGAEWLLPCEPGDDIDKAFSSYFHSLGLPAPSRITRCQALASTVALIAKADVICMATQPTFQFEMKRRRIRELKLHESPSDIDVYVVQRRERPLTSAASRFLSCVEEAAMR